MKKMNSIRGSEATVTLDHVQEVVSCGGVKVKITSNDSKPNKCQNSRHKFGITGPTHW
jgi:hypothetical protein